MRLAIFVLLLTSCGNQNAPLAQANSTTGPTATLTSTPDPCSAENISASIKAVNDLMREFDDVFKLAAGLSQEKVPESISQMQRIRRAAEDQEIPACLSNLKSYQLAHMNTAIKTLLAFIGGAQSETLTDGINRARQEHDLYTLEVARLLGINTNSTPTP